MKNKKNGFTLVELLAVIVILAVILVIAVPKVMDIITDAKKGTLESTAKMIASQAEKKKIENSVLESTSNISCNSVTKLNNIDYKKCYIRFIDNTAKVTIEGSGKFEGLNVCAGTKSNSKAVYTKCTTPFVEDDWKTIVEEVRAGNYPYEVGDTREIDLGDLGKHMIRVANTTPCNGTLSSQSACGFVLEFADIITTFNMSPNGEYNGKQYDGTSVGGWPATAMRVYLNEIVYNLIPKDLREAIIDTYVVSSHGASGGTLEDYNHGSIDKLYLLSIREVWGKVNVNSNQPIYYDSAIGDAVTKQLDWYEKEGVTTSLNKKKTEKTDGNNTLNWWLTSPYSGNNGSFCTVTSEGSWQYVSPTKEMGVSPAFRIETDNNM